MFFFPKELLRFLENFFNIQESRTIIITFKDQRHKLCFFTP